MISQASAKYQRVSPRKARVIANLVRGRNTSDALLLLDFTTKAAAPVVKKLIRSAVANAAGTHPDVQGALLYISKVIM